MQARSKFIIPLLGVLLSLMAIVLIACQASTGTPAPQETPAPTVPGETPSPGDPGSLTLASVQDLQIQILESFPVQVRAVATGSLTDSCQSISRVVEERNGNAFQVSIFVARAGEVCAQVVTPFEQVVDLDVLGLPAGTYTVDVNGLTDEFVLEVDNVAVDESASISGMVWHDLCALAVDQSGNPVQPTPGCIQINTGNFEGNGILEPGEPGIGGVLVDLGLGACPSTGLGTAVTGSDGIYSFPNLAEGTYCISIDPLKGQNTTALIPGQWTSPARDVSTAAVTLTLGPGENKSGVNFGWDFQFAPEPPVLPTPVPTPTPTPIPIPCDWFQFISDVTIPDGTVFAPGTPFTKIWRLKNTGTCTWTNAYSLVFVSGDRMDGQSVVPLASTVRPGETVDVGVGLVAPTAVGDYRGNWTLRNGSGVLFGSGSNASSPFYVDIDVREVNRIPFYEFASSYCEATWVSGVGTLPCPGTTDTKDGFVIRLTDPSLEDRQENEPALWVHPNHAGESWIQGTYPAIRIKEGDRFRAWIGCLNDVEGCDVRFQLGFINQNGVLKIIGDWREVSDGKSKILDLDLSPYAGQDLAFVLRLDTVNDRPDVADGYWFVPYIARVDRNIP